MDTPNYEAIGRYITASKAAKAAAQTRNEALNRLALVVKTAAAAQSGRCLAAPVNVEALRRLVNEIESAHAQMLVLMAEANAVAADANEPALKLTNEL